MRLVLKFLGFWAAATAGAYLAYVLVAFVCFEWPRLLLAFLTPIELDGFEAPSRYAFMSSRLFPGAVTSFPSEGTAGLYALYAGGPFLWGATLLGLVAAAGRRARGWGKLFCVHAVCWLTLPVLLYSAAFIGWSSGPLVTALRALGPGWAESLSVRVLLGLGVGVLAAWALTVSIRSLLDSAAETRTERSLALVQWLVLPTTFAALLLNFDLLRFRSFFVLLYIFGPALLALLVGMAAVLRRRRRAPRLQPGLAGAVVLVLASGTAFGASLSYSHVLRFARQTNLTEYESRYWRLHFEPAALASIEPTSFAHAADERLAGIAQRLGLKPPNPLLHSYVYTSANSKRLAAGSDEPFTVDAEHQGVYHLLAADGHFSDARGDALLLLQVAWGEAGSATVARALARYAVGDFEGRTLADYAARITHEERPYRLREVLKLEEDYVSPLVRDALGGAWVEFLAERRSQEVLPLLYRTPLVAGKEEEFARTLGFSWQELEENWQRYQVKNAERGREQAVPASRAVSFFHRGISFSHEVGGRGGYGSDRAAKELERIRNLGANTVAVVPYAFTRAPRETRIYFGTDERDDRVIRTLETAHRLGLRTMLKPQLWGRSFTGDIVFESDAEFERFFGQYRRWLLHFARLAELHRVDLLVVGTELGGLSGREAAWSELIADVRRIYSGHLTYAAHWRREFGTLPFWDALDYLGLNMYYPLAEPGEIPRPDSPRVQALVEKFAAMSKQHNKPLLFTEVGYPSIASAAVEPWKEGSAALNLELQAGCYATVFEAFSGQPWFAGLYWWKWPSHGRGAPYDGSFNLLGKPAVKVVERWYQQAEGSQ